MTPNAAGLTVPVRTGALAEPKSNTATWQLRLVHRVLRSTLRPGLDLLVWMHTRNWITVARIGKGAQRLDQLAGLLPTPRGTRTQRVDFGDCHAEWLWDHSWPPSDPFRRGGVILYFHGGGLVCGGLNTHRRMVARIAAAAGLPALNVAYRQIPDAHITATIQDCVNAYRLVLREGVPADRIVLAGDSVGAGLAISTAVHLRDHDVPLPAAIVALSPWADFDSAQRRHHANARREPFTPDSVYQLLVRWGVARDGQLDPIWSPVNQELTGLPPVLVHAGTTEVLLPDAERLVARCMHAQVPVVFRRWDHGVHVLPLYAPLIPDAQTAIADIARFIRSLPGWSPNS